MTIFFLSYQPMIVATHISQLISFIATKNSPIEITTWPMYRISHHLDLAADAFGRHGQRTGHGHGREAPWHATHGDAASVWG